MFQRKFEKKVQSESILMYHPEVIMFFPDGLWKLDCKDILFNPLKKLDNQPKQVFLLSQQNKESQIRGTDRPNKNMGFINEKFHQYEKDRQEKGKKEKSSKKTPER